MVEISVLALINEVAYLCIFHHQQDMMLSHQHLQHIHHLHLCKLLVLQNKSCIVQVTAVSGSSSPRLNKKYSVAQFKFYGSA